MDTRPFVCKFRLKSIRLDRLQSVQVCSHFEEFIRSRFTLARLEINDASFKANDAQFNRVITDARTSVQFLPFDRRTYHARSEAQPVLLSHPDQPTQAQWLVISHESEAPVSQIPHPYPLPPSPS